MNYKKTFLLGFGFLGVSLLWVLYNSYVPIFLQAGNPAFDEHQGAVTVGFGLSAVVAGFIMTLDNIAAFFIQPLIGVRPPHPLHPGRSAAGGHRLCPDPRGCEPDPAPAFGSDRPTGPAVDLLYGRHRPHAVGHGRLSHAPHRPDARHHPLALPLAVLYGFSIAAPFWVGAILLIVSALVVFWAIKEPNTSDAVSDEEGRWWDTLKEVGAIPSEERRSLALLLAAIFAWFVGYNAIETFFTSYGTFRLGVAESTASLLLGFFSLTFIIFSVPGGMLAERLGRRRTILGGLVALTLLLVLASFLPNVYAIGAILFLGGIAWAMININSLPMVVDIAPDDRLLGTYTGLYYISGTLAAIVGPILNGWIIDASGKNYNTIFWVAPAFMLLAIGCMWFVTRGEART